MLRGPRLGMACAAAFAIVPIFAAFALAKPGASCSSEGAVRAEVKSVNERLELTLADGKLLKLAGIDPPGPTPSDPELDTKTQAKLAAWVSGREILFRMPAERPDRWGRISALVFAPMGSADLAVGEALLDAGLARYAPGADARVCRAALLAAEAKARERRLGLWADPYYMILGPDDRAAFDEKSGTNVIVEGRVTGIDRGPFRTTLSFGPRRGFDFSVTIVPRNIKLFDAAGIDLSRLEGQILRVRGLLDLRFGPQIELSNPDEVEVLTTSAATPARNSSP